MGINNKKKGSRVEREIAKLLSNRFSIHFDRVPMSGAYATSHCNLDIKAKETLSGDIICPDDFLFSVEVKSRKDFDFFDFFNKSGQIHDWLNQCERDANRSYKFPLLILKVNRREIICFFKKDNILSNFIFNDWKILTIKQFLENNNCKFFKEITWQKIIIMI